MNASTANASESELRRERSRKVDDIVETLFSHADYEFLSSAISREEGRLLRELSARPNVTSTIEIGCANGISTLYICAGLAGKDGANHTAIDPYQMSAFGGKGVDNVRRANVEFFQLIEKPSEMALPELLSAGKCYDLALIDGLHTADQTMVDFYYLDRMLRAGGVIVFDDVHAPAVNKIARYALTYPNYRLVAVSGRRGRLRGGINALKHLISLATWPLRALLRETAFREIFDVSLSDPKLLWTIDSHTMIALEKLGDYERDTNWYRGI